MLPGHIWGGEFYVAAIEDLKDLDLTSNAKGVDAKLSIHTVREIVVDNHSGYIFPCKKRYDATNRTIEGALNAEADAGDTWD